MDRRVYDNYVIQIMKHGSITAAARALGITQPALSNGLTHLEKELGYKLVNRKDVPITLTDEGAVYFDYINRIGTLTADLNRRIDCLHEERNSSVRIGAPVSYAGSIVADAVARLLSEYPDFRATVKEAPIQTLIDMTLHGELDCFISTSDELPEPFAKEFVMEEKIWLGIPASFPDEQISGRNFIFLEEGLPLQERVRRYFEEHDIVPKCVATVSQTSTAIELAERGVGICFASEEALKNTQLKTLRLPMPSRSIYVAYDSELFMPKACSELISILCSDFHETGIDRGEKTVIIHR